MSRTTAGLVAIAAVVLLAGCGSVTSAGGPPPGSTEPQGMLPGRMLGEVQAISEHDGRFTFELRTVEGVEGCFAEPRARATGHDRRTLWVDTTYFSSNAEGCTEEASRPVSARLDLGGRRLVVNQELWKPGPGASWVRCSTTLGCHPPADRCDDAWVDTILANTEMPPEKQVDILACDGRWLVLRVDAVATGCQSLDGSTPPASCEGTGLHTYWYAGLTPDRTWDVMASSETGGCGQVQQEVPAFPTKLCSAATEAR